MTLQHPSFSEFHLVVSPVEYVHIYTYIILYVESTWFASASSAELNWHIIWRDLQLRCDPVCKERRVMGAASASAAASEPKALEGEDCSC
jgi:hypothetical protein